MLITEFDFNLPQELIAQYPSDKRDESRLMVVHFKSGKIEHRKFKDIVHYLDENHVLVINNTKVLKARIFCRRKDTGGKIEFLFLNAIDNKSFNALAKPSRKAKKGIVFSCGEGLLKVKEHKDGYIALEILSFENVYDFFERYGVMPLPPYIRRPATKTDEKRYQTVFAKKRGSIAAPTAGLHFSEDVMRKLKGNGVDIYEVTLHVGLGTFKPVKVEEVEQHKMDEEHYEIHEDVARALIGAKRNNKTIISVGTTSTRTLESWGLSENKLKGDTGLFIYPGYKFKVIDGLLTNFHLPKSTPLLLVSALCGIELLKRAYRIAIEERYRFFSYGDAMLLLGD